MSQLVTSQCFLLVTLFLARKTGLFSSQWSVILRLGRSNSCCIWKRCWKRSTKVVLWVQTEAHGPQDLCVLLAHVVKGVHQLLQITMGCQDLVETVCNTVETVLNILTPDQLCNLETHMIFSIELTCSIHTPQWFVTIIYSVNFYN